MNQRSTSKEMAVRPWSIPPSDLFGMLFERKAYPEEMDNWFNTKEEKMGNECHDWESQVWRYAIRGNLIGPKELYDEEVQEKS